jgi:indole-3-glycerol phosphate synthase
MILDEILARTAERVSQLDADPSPVLRYPSRSLSDAIADTGGDVAIIAELKYASPSGGASSCQEDPGTLAGDLIAAGCAGLSVLTEPYFFAGSTHILSQVRQCSPVPVLRKDFIIDERQIAETKVIGADAILLIAKILGNRLTAFVERSRAAGLEPLVEVHSPGEVKSALLSGATLFGINNRDLRTMEVDLDTTRRLSPLLRKEGCVVISMSGIRGPADIRSLRHDCDAFLVGTALMQSPDPKRTLGELLCA